MDHSGAHRARGYSHYACAATDAACTEAAKTYATPQTTRIPLTVRNAFWRLRGPEIDVVLNMTPPRVMP